MRVWMVVLFAIGCATEDVSRTEQGVAEVRLDGRALAALAVSSVIVESPTRSQEIFFNPVTGTFDGTVLLDTGVQTLVASAYAGGALVGRSNPTAVEIEAGAVTRVALRILDLTAPPPTLYGPLLDSLVHPTTTEAGAAVTFAIAVVAPDGAPIAYHWSTIGCVDGSFGSPAAASTSWSKATPGGCTVQVTATSNGLTIAESFAIAVFPAGAASGAAAVDIALVTPPVVDLALFDLGCYAGVGTNASCAGSPRAPTAEGYGTSVLSWGNSTPGTFEVFDSCGGRFGTEFHNESSRSGHWLPPVGGGLCLLTARATNGDGLVGTRTAAVLARPGTPAAGAAPTVYVQAGPGAITCSYSSLDGLRDCGTLSPGASMIAYASVDWAGAHPGSVEVFDDCDAGIPAPQSAYNFVATWTFAGAHRVCLMTITATSLEGDARSANARYVIE